MTEENGRFALADARAQMIEEALSLSGSLNVRRTVLSLITLFRPRLADWAILVVPDTVTGGLVLFGGSEAVSALSSRAIRWRGPVWTESCGRAAPNFASRRKPCSPPTSCPA